jgi:hypothetical protein
VLRSLRTSFNCGSPSTLSHASLPRTALGWTLLCNMKLSHLAFNANPRLPFVKQRAKTQVANVEAGSETELMPPRLALHAGVDRRVAEVQLELLACAGVTWSRVETRGMYVGRGDSRPHKLDPRCTSAWQRLLAQGIFLGSPQQTVFQNLQLSQAL